MLRPLWLGQATGAMQMEFAQPGRSRTTRSRTARVTRRTKVSKPKRMKMATRLSKPKRRVLVKGSAAAKRYMASIRRKRKT